jgi:hypothetical protein
MVTQHGEIWRKKLEYNDVDKPAEFLFGSIFLSTGILIPTNEIIIKGSVKDS